MKMLMMSIFTAVLLTGCSIGECPTDSIKRPVFGGK